MHGAVHPRFFVGEGVDGHRGQPFGDPLLNVVEQFTEVFPVRGH